jgi:hypothetical protein
MMAKSGSLQGSLDLLVLKIRSRQPRLHGYRITSAIRESSGDVLRADEGSLYPALRLDELTAAGKKQLADEESRWHALTSAVNLPFRSV